MDTQWEGIKECFIFVSMMGTEIIWKQTKKTASQIMVTTVTESLGTFLMVSLTLLVFDGGCLTRIPGITERLRQKV